MSDALSDQQLRLLRLRSQRLLAAQRDPGASLTEIVREICGVQSQDNAAGALSIRARSAGLLAEQVRRARLEERSLVRTWCMRGTLHLVAAGDVRWMLELLGPDFIRADRGRMAQLGLDGEKGTRAVRLIRDAVADHGPQTRAELAAVLAKHNLPSEGQVPFHAIYRAVLEGAICEGPERGAKQTYVLLEDWIGPGKAPSRETALPELARRYLRGYGPSTPEDLAIWSGLAKREARVAWQSIAGELIEVPTAMGPTWMLKSQADWLEEIPHHAPPALLLPIWDTLLLGYGGRGLFLSPEHVGPARTIATLRPSLLVDGRVAGTWRSRRERGELVISLTPSDDLAATKLAAAEAEVSDIGRFMGLPARLRISELA